MKVCERCGAIIEGRDGENRCVACDGKVRASAKSNRARREVDAVMRDLGLVRVRGALGGTYYE